MFRDGINVAYVSLAKAVFLYSCSSSPLLHMHQWLILFQLHSSSCWPGQECWFKQVNTDVTAEAPLDGSIPEKQNIVVFPGYLQPRLCTSYVCVLAMHISWRDLRYLCVWRRVTNAFEKEIMSWMNQFSGSILSSILILSSSSS